MRILFISSCTGEKKYKPTNQLGFTDFQGIGTKAFRRREKELSEFKLPAGEMYTGQQHVRLVRGVDLLRTACPSFSIDLKIVSAGYGLIDEETPIVPYEMTFNGMKAKALRQWADTLKIPEKASAVVEGYDLVVFLLGKEYIRAINFPSEWVESPPCLFLTGKSSLPYLPKGSNIKPVLLGNKDAKRFGAGLVALKGRVIEALGEHAEGKSPAAIEKLFSTTEKLIAFIGTYKKSKKAAKGQKHKKPPIEKSPKKADPDALLKADYDSRVIKLPKSWVNKKHRKKMRYFIPEWDDLVNPAYDFESDIHPEGTCDGYEFGHYAHQIYSAPPYDGILVSKVVMDMKKKKWAIFEKLGVHRYLRVPREFPVMGDCGAFGYVDQEVPPYETSDILEYYQRFDFDYGVSIDHLIVNAVLKRERYFIAYDREKLEEVSKEKFDKMKADGLLDEISSLNRQLKLFEDGPCLYRDEILDEGERQRRYDLTINNAKEFIEGHKKGKFQFKPIGAVQGWSPESYADAVREYQKMGYTYLALGSLVRTKTDKILTILEEVKKVLKPGVDLHLFGVARPDGLEQMHRLGVTSIDSASFLRRAWLGASSNYFMPEDRFAAIRIPQAEKSPRAKKMVREGKISLAKVKTLEEKCLRLLRAYDKGNADIDDVFEAVMTYDELMGGNRNGHARLIRKTLEEKPWEKCGCEICSKHGVEVIIFRGNNRNRRRGFHNTKFFYDQFCHMFGDE